MTNKNDLKRREALYSAYDNSQNNNTNYVGRLPSTLSDNPYAAALDSGSYKNKRDAKTLYKSALEYEASLSQYERQLADQLKYSDPAFLRMRDLAAGINPDLSAGSGSGSSGSFTAPAMGVTSLEPFTDPVQDLATITTGAASVASAFDSTISGLSGVVTLGQQVATFSDALRLSSVTADSAEMQALSSRIGTLGDLTAMMPPKMAEDGSVIPFSVSDVSSFLKSAGISDPDNTLAEGAAAFSSNPAMQRFYSDQVLSARQARADLISQPFEVLRTISENSFKSRQLKTDCELISSQFDYWYDSYHKTENNATLAAGNDSQELLNDSLRGVYDQDRINQDINAFQGHLSALARMGSSMRSRIDDLKKLPRTSSVSSAIVALEAAYNDIMNKGSDELGKIYDLRRRFERDYYDSSTILRGTPGDIYPTEFEMKDRYITFGDLVVAGGQAESGPIPLLDDLFGLLKAYLGRKTKIVRGR